MKTSMVLLTTTPEYILEENSKNSNVLDAFDSLDKQKNATAKSCKTVLVDDSKKGEWVVKVLFDWQLDPTGAPSNDKPGDLEVVVKWKRKTQGLEYEILKCDIHESTD
jgi:hypothetical protein